MINGRTKTCGLIGNPVEHTMSPTIHNRLSEMLHTNLVYVPFHVEKNLLQEAVEGAFALNLWGLNVTVPYKSEVLTYLKEVDPLAARIGAVNTLVKTEGGYKGYNTDMPGLFRALESDGIQIPGEHIIVLGAGGAARAVTVLLAEKGAEEIILCNRTIEKAGKIADEVNGYMGRNVVRVLPLSGYEELKGRKYLAIQATSVGLHPNDQDAIILDKDFYNLLHTGYDLIFNPSSTRFMKLTEEAGGRAINGLKMLLYQGIISYELWNGIQVSQESAMEIYKLLKEEMG